MDINYIRLKKIMENRSRKSLHTDVLDLIVCPVIWVSKKGTDTDVDSNGKF